jgi:hypothetical protein
MENVVTDQAEPGVQKVRPVEVLGNEREEQDRDHGFKISVIYNGVEKEFRIKPNETVKQLLDQAIQAFGITANVHTLSLYSEGGQELGDGQTIKDAGIKPHNELLLRPSAVKGGQ